jgi:exopolysaccharide biosynthesis polyprenyl glycosylphosphotransferase
MSSVPTYHDPAKEPALGALGGARVPLSSPLRPPPEALPGLVRERSREGQQSPDVELYLQLCRVTDTVIAVSVLLGMFVIDNLGRLPRGIDDFLGARLTVKNVLLVLVFAGAWHLSCQVSGVYDWANVKSRTSEAVRACIAATGGTLIALIFPLSSVSGSFRLEALPPFWAFVTALMLVARGVLRSSTVARVNRAHSVLIVGTGPRAQALHRHITTGSAHEWNIIGFVDSSAPSEPSGVNVVCRLDGLESFLVTQELDEVLIALPVKSCYSEIQSVIHICERVGVPFKYSANLFTHARMEPRVEGSLSGPLLSVPACADGPGTLVKRGLDLAGAALALLVLSPVLGALALVVKLTSPGPVLFAQVRYGRNRRRFRMYKFRTMVQDAEAQQMRLEAMNEAHGPVFKIRRDPRITPVGAFLRRTSLDEVPQLWNVLRGEMSLVGPRPLPVRDVERFGEPWLMRRFSVRPGITGLWQVSGRSTLSFDKWIQLDLAYIDQWSLWLDLVILGRTIPAVIFGRGAS